MWLQLQPCQGDLADFQRLLVPQDHYVERYQDELIGWICEILEYQAATKKRPVNADCCIVSGAAPDARIDIDWRRDLTPGYADAPVKLRVFQTHAGRCGHDVLGHQSPILPSE